MAHMCAHIARPTEAAVLASGRSVQRLDSVWWPVEMHGNIPNVLRLKLFKNVHTESIEKYDRTQFRLAGEQADKRPSGRECGAEEIGVDASAQCAI